MKRGSIGFWMRFAEFLVRPMLWFWTKPDWRGQERIPASGPAILVYNHISYADPFVAAHFVFDRPRDIRVLAKASLFAIPIGGYILRQIRQIPVYRHTTDAGKALEAAVDAVNSGEAIVIYPEGTCTKDPDLWPMQGKTGAARLALMTGAPVIPIAQWGAQAIHHPITRKIRLRPRTPVIVSAGEPIDLSAFEGQPLLPEVLREATDVIMRQLRDDVAALRGEPAPTGPLFVPPPKPPKPPKKIKPTATTPEVTS